MTTTIIISIGALGWGFFLIERNAKQTYRRWYLLCRNELEQLDPMNRALVKIGARTSKREPWESENG